MNSCLFLNCVNFEWTIILRVTMDRSNQTKRRLKGISQHVPFKAMTIVMQERVKLKETKLRSACLWQFLSELVIPWPSQCELWWHQAWLGFEPIERTLERMVLVDLEENRVVWWRFYRALCGMCCTIGVGEGRVLQLGGGAATSNQRWGSL